MYRVFLVDDEPFIIEGLYDVVDWPTLGLEIVGHASNGEKALEALRETPADILITDISMPVMNGLQLIRSVRELRPGMKCIILSGFNEFDYIKEGLTLGIENYLLKPINLEELGATLANTVEKLDDEKETKSAGWYDINILKDNILHRWLKGRISPNELSERAELLGIELNHAYILAAVVRTEREFREVYDTAVDFCKQQAGTVPFADHDEDLVLLFLFDEPEEGKRKAVETLTRLKAHFPTTAGARVSLGSVEPLKECAAESYANAKKAQEYFLLYDKDALLDFAELAVHREETGPRFSIEWNDYSQLLLAKEKDKLLERIGEDFVRLQQSEGTTPERLQSFAIELLIRFKLELKEMKHDDLPDLFKDDIENVFEASTVERLAEIAKEAASVTVDSLNRDVKSPVIQQILKQIHESYSEPLSLKAFGKQFHIHPNYLGQLFQKETHETFTEYINRYRIEKAKQMLKESHEKVHEIARKVGYWEPGYFYKQFKKHVGVSPTEYKELL
ncbi:response regulator transcription factor [Paenibacillus thermotolerans]|uniref:response regulator transcription factor n=1 Tax=Paenibacillus thermotolerans TaxID=3027807 RepID=UPI00236808FF|nr:MULTISPECIES: response regulator transcription factor [unclassified Paenibacillus]